MAINSTQTSRNFFEICAATLCLVCCACLFAAKAYSQGSSESPAAKTYPSLANISEFWDAAKVDETKSLVYEFDWETTILFYDPYWHLLWISDQNRVGSYFPVKHKTLPFLPGQKVRMSGKLIPQEGLDLDQVTIKELASPVFPSPQLLSENPNTTLEQNFRYVAVEGFVDTQSRPDPNHIDLLLLSNGRSINAKLVLKTPQKVPDLTHTFIRFEGLLVAELNNQNQDINLVVWSVDPKNLGEYSLSKASPFETPAIPIGEIEKHSDDKTIRLEGTVQSYEKEGHLAVTDNSGYINILPSQNSQLLAGDTIEVIGTPRKSGNQWTLDNAIYRHTTLFGPDGKKRNRSTTKSGPLRLAQEVFQLDSTQAAQNRVATLEGVITFADLQKQYFYLNDISGGIRIQANLKAIPIGNHVEISGTVAPGDFSPFIKANQINISGLTPLPESKKISYEQAMTGMEEGQWVQMSGNLSSYRDEDDFHILELSTPTGDFTAKVSISIDPLQVPLGSQIAIQGVCIAEEANGSQLAKVSLLTPSVQNIQITNTAPKDPFDYDQTAIADLPRYRSQNQSNNRARTSGIVLHNIPGKSLFISDGKNSLNVLTNSSLTLHPGDIVDVVGLPGRNGNNFALRNAIVRITGKGPALTPDELSNGAALEKSAYAQLVTFKGTLLDSSQNDEQIRLATQVDGSLAEILLNSNPGTPIKKWENGTLLQITGICVNKEDEYKASDSITILVNSQDDIEILQLPSWWTEKRTLAVLGASTFALFLGSAWGVTLRRRVRSQTNLIRQQLDKEKQLIEAATDFIFTLDLEGNFTSFNPTSESITGYSREEIATMKVYDLLSRPDARLARLAFSRRRTLAETKSLQSEIIRKDGSKLWVETSSRFLRNNGEVEGMFSIMRDISLRKKTNQELVRARDAAEANTKAKSAFLATMSHELRTPMNGVLGMANILLDTDLDTNQRDYAQTIRDSGESLLTLLNDILDLSKAEAGKLSLEPFEFDLKETLQLTTKFFDSIAQEKKNSLKLSIAKDTPNLLIGDVGRVRQVILNLIGNAIKFTDNGQIEILVSEIPNDEPKTTLRIEIKDTGVGITEEARSRLFRPFEQADGSHSRRFGGTGLGLAISKQIVELMGGQIGVESEVGKGSSFWFTLKLEKIDERESTPDEADSPQKAKKRQRWQGPPLQILMAEDTLINQRVTQLQLKKIGLAADLAENGLEVLKAVTEKPYDIILMDCQMPEMDGYEATRQLRQDPIHKHIHIIALTANAMAGDRERCFAAGMNGFVSKPTRPDALLEAISKFADPNQPKLVAANA